MASSPAGIDCTASCQASFDSGTSVLLTATPAAGEQFAGWSGDCGGTGGCMVILQRNAAVIANFQPAPRLHTLAVSLGPVPGGRVSSFPFGLNCASGSCTGTFAEGTVVQLTALPGPGVQFSSWSGACFGATPCSLVISGDLSASALFVAGPPPASCARLVPGAPPMRQFVHQLDQTSSVCLPGMADTAGTLSFPRLFQDPSHHGTAIDFISSGGSVLREVGLPTETPRPTQQRLGLSVWGGPAHLSPIPDEVLADNFDSSGAGSHEVTIGGTNIAGGAEALDGPILAGDFVASTRGTSLHSVLQLNAGGSQSGIRWGPVALASPGAVFGTGQDLFGNAIVITSGAAKFGGGSISAQWFNANGAPLTLEFLLLSNFVPGPNTWFETSALIGGGVMVRRMDQVSGSVTHAQAMVTVGSGDTNAAPAPSWMTSRPDTRLKAALGGRGYAVLPFGAPGVSCLQTIEVLASSGDRCGAIAYPIADGTCDTLALMLGEDGSVIQQLPKAMEASDTASVAENTCTWRW